MYSIKYHGVHDNKSIYERKFENFEDLCTWCQINSEIKFVEQWKWIRGYEDLYQVSSFGRVRSYHGKKTKITRGWSTKFGYRRTDLTKDGKRRTVYIHRVVAAHFCENPDPEKYVEVDHINRVRDDNAFWNLRWATKDENMKNRKFYTKELPF